MGFYYDTPLGTSCRSLLLPLHFCCLCCLNHLTDFSSKTLQFIFIIKVTLLIPIIVSVIPTTVFIAVTKFITVTITTTVVVLFNVVSTMKLNLAWICLNFVIIHKLDHLLRQHNDCHPRFSWHYHFDSLSLDQDYQLYYCSFMIHSYF